ncbi:AcrB/AcrD/AcrF family protein [Desulfonema ishimotonii]|uniref:AcrB/AcrD/AcrF family protein n=1 Tax=Desulfonema ishimotonii TaxID=45657 RepID=A0A401FWL2_9BACT|nr:efflux RND transporter permease subunit [Desulfonema ishimotonii]GBC61329.1 AcrB/AcrD/AcrF family protein [Desulfonema ishimotonii]
MNLPKYAIENRTVTWFAVFLLTVAGIASFFSLGQLEDPEFTIKTATIITAYPGASPEEVELEVTDRIELAIQELPELDHVESVSRAGLSIVKVDIRASYWKDRLPQVWDKLRRKIRDIEMALPSGAGRPDVGDDFGDVFGFQLALTGDGYTHAEMETYAKQLRKELLLVDGVARIDFWGVQSKVVWLDVSQTQLSEMGLTEANILDTLAQQNVIVDAGNLDLQNRRFRIEPTGAFGSVEEIGDLTIRPTTPESETDPSVSSELIRIRDIGTIRFGYQEPQNAVMRYNGQPAIGISITNTAGINIVDLGRAIDTRLVELTTALPVGIEVRRVHWQSDVVDEAVMGFFINFAEALFIVLIVLTLFMGWRMGIIIGIALVLTILTSFIFMAVFHINLQRMSLGALVVALGMMVDNAIVVADGFMIRVQKGIARKQAAIEAASQPAMPLLGATIVAVMAFYPIFGSPREVGEYCRTLFTVIGISLLSSWVISVTVTPLQCLDMLPAPRQGEEKADPFDTRFYRKFRTVLSWAIRRRFLTMTCMVALLIASFIGFGNVSQLFFTDSSMSKFMIDFWTPEGSRIQDVSAMLKKAEKKILDDGRVESVATFVGQGPPRFYLPVEPELPYPAYGQLIVNTKDFREIDGLIDDLRPWFAEHFPDASVPLRKYTVGPGNTYKFEVRISGPAVADPDRLRSLADSVLAILNRSPLSTDNATDWRNRVQKLVPVYNQERARWAGITRDDIARATKRAFDGRTVGYYRERDDLIPIIMRHADEDRADVGGLDMLQIQSAASTEAVPLSQIVDEVRTDWEDPIIWRRDRRRTITVQANPVSGVTLPTLRASVLDQISAIELPPGYTLEWGGEHEDSVNAQKSLIPGVIPALAIMSFIVVALFNAFRPPLIIACTIPFAFIGITVGLLTADAPLSFMGQLGAMSLVGMMIKNVIVLLDEVSLNLAAGKSRYEAITDAAVSRLRPVFLASATTVLGVIPLLQDVFWISMAVNIMAGLSFGTLVTMIVVPVLYSIFFRVNAREGREDHPADVPGNRSVTKRLSGEMP